MGSMISNVALKNLDSNQSCEQQSSEVLGENFPNLDHMVGGCDVGRVCCSAVWAPLYVYVHK